MTLAYDPVGRLYQTATPASTTRFAWDGDRMVAEYNAANVLQRRYVHGPGVDEPVVWYEGTALTDKRWLMGDERGSIISVTNGAGTVLGINRYDEFGNFAPTNIGRFQYTGQMLLPEAGLYHYKARAYSPTLGRFMQSDPIGYADGMNFYNYVGGDPVNFTDPSGLVEFISICRGGYQIIHSDYSWTNVGEVCEYSSWGGSSINIPRIPHDLLERFPEEEIVVTAKPAQGPCNSKWQTLIDAGEVAEDVFFVNGAILGAVGFAAVGPAGAKPGLFFMNIGNGVGTLSQVGEDILHNRPLSEIAMRGVANAFGGRALSAGLNALNHGRKFPIVDEVFERAGMDGISFVYEWLDPEYCP